MTAIASVDKPWDVAIATHNGRHKVYVASNADGWIYAAALSGGALERHVYAPGVRGLAAVNSLQRLFWVDAGALYSIPYGDASANSSTDDASVSTVASGFGNAMDVDVASACPMPIATACRLSGAERRAFGYGSRCFQDLLIGHAPLEVH